MSKIFDEIMSKRLLMVNGDLSKIEYPEKNLSEMSTKEIREYVAFFDNRNQFRAMTKVLAGQDESQIVQDLNEELDRRVGKDFATIYNYQSLGSIKNFGLGNNFKKVQKGEF